MNLIILTVSFYINAFLSRDSTAIKIEYSLPEGVQKIEVFYEYKGKNYLVGVFNNPLPEKKLKDFFIWQTKKKWRAKGNLNVVVHYKDKRVEKHFICGKNLPISPALNKTNEIIFISDGFIKEKGDWYGIVFKESEKSKVKSQNLKIRESGFGSRDSGFGNRDETVKRFMVKSKINEKNETNTITPSHDLFNPPKSPFSKGEYIKNEINEMNETNEYFLK